MSFIALHGSHHDAPKCTTTFDVVEMSDARDASSATVRKREEDMLLKFRCVCLRACDLCGEKEISFLRKRPGTNEVFEEAREEDLNATPSVTDARCYYKAMRQR